MIHDRLNLTSVQTLLFFSSCPVVRFSCVYSQVSLLGPHQLFYLFSQFSLVHCHIILFPAYRTSYFVIFQSSSRFPSCQCVCFFLACWFSINKRLCHLNACLTKRSSLNLTSREVLKSPHGLIVFWS